MAIQGFEDKTHELNEYELTVLVPNIVRHLKTKVGEKNAVTNSYVCKKYKEAGKKLSSVRFRKIINHIRIHGLVFNLVASSKGYYVANSQSECERFIESLDQRINAITKVRDAMFYQMNRTIKENEKPHNDENK